MNSSHPAMFVVFGRPGAGKTTLSEEAVRLITDNDNLNSENFLHLDLDVCVPQWMRDNFSKGIYPTLQQRNIFIEDACHYVRNQIQSAPKALSVIIAFSFVNTDMRVAFREQFPHSKWILVDTKKDLAEERILAREGHFYKVANNTRTITKTDECPKQSTDDSDNSEWEFQPVDFDHSVLDGRNSISDNAKRIADIIEETRLECTT